MVEAEARDKDGYRVEVRVKTVGHKEQRQIYIFYRQGTGRGKDRRFSNDRNSKYIKSFIKRLRKYELSACPLMAEAITNPCFEKIAI